MAGRAQCRAAGERESEAARRPVLVQVVGQPQEAAAAIMTMTMKVGLRTSRRRGARRTTFLRPLQAQ